MKFGGANGHDFQRNSFVESDFSSKKVLTKKNNNTCTKAKCVAEMHETEMTEFIIVFYVW